MYHQALLDKYSNSVAPTSRRQLTSRMSTFLLWLDQRPLSMAEVHRWIKKLRQKGYADNTLKAEWETLRQLFKVNGISWEAARGDAPTVDPEKVWSPTLDPPTIKAMIDIALKPPAKKDLWHPDVRDTCFLFISTIWGLRRVELTRLTPASLNQESSLIHVDTAKGGRSRWHWVPPDVMHFITDWGFAYPTSLTTASAIFNRFRLAVGIQTDQELGWHSIRHSLARYLIEAGVPAERRKQFMRWAISKSKQDMGESYGTSPIVGLSGVRRELKVEEQKSDEFVLERHPFLKLWRGQE